MAFNKMFVMIPVMLAARKLDGENPDTVFYLRCAYGAVQTAIVLLVAYIFIQSRSLSAGKDKDRLIYVPPAPTPFEDPNAPKKKYTEKTFGAHVSSQAVSLLGSTLFGVLLTVGLHYYKGMVVGLAIQSVMGPLNLMENALAKTVLLGGGLGADVAAMKIFGEKTRDELTKDDEVVDEAGNVVVRMPAGAPSTTGSTKKKAAKKEPERSFEDILLDTWDAGADADVKPLLAALTKKTVNYKTSDSQWTPCMILSAIGVPNTDEALAKCKSLGGNPAATDEEGWNALHWAAFHGSPEGARYLLADDGYGGIKLGLAAATDKEGKTPLEHAKAEGNAAAAKIIEEATATAEASEGGAADDGIRKRK
mmetsp:Transcript_3396/g.7414  ORF Transcript_3396/g.7414 Transcript_3396/m.7414 type:complete len:364 (+) Transcript_3396:331-1422(+)